ncbi:MAG: hypothetical protein H6671_10320 [Anaerolineaceae bacterium]|nr:hypothetical protein [Anaerolineaceae bacterium]
MLRPYVILVFVLLLALAACSPESQAVPTNTPTTVPTEAAMADMTEEAMPEVTEAPMDATEETIADMSEEPVQAAEAAAPTEYDGPDWASLPITNARTGEIFTLADFAGKTVFVEPMATWCTNCRRQLGSNVRPAFEQSDPEQVVFISFSVGENVTDQRLAEYANEQGWEWIFAVASTEITAGMTADYGRGVITPPSTPHFVIGPTGTLSALSTGFEGTDTLLAQINEATGS